MEIRYKQADSLKELEQILELQVQNLPDSLTREEREQQGFVTVRHDLELLKKMNDVCGHVIAKDGSQLAGYALSMHPEFSNSIPVLKPMFKRLEKLLPDTCRYLVMGQVCVSRAYRSRGIFRGLYQNMQQLLANDFELIVTEVDEANQRSMKAHEAIGFKELCRYSSGGQDWHVISLPTAPVHT